MFNPGVEPLHDRHPRRRRPHPHPPDEVKPDGCRERGGDTPGPSITPHAPRPGSRRSRIAGSRSAEDWRSAAPTGRSGSWTRLRGCGLWRAADGQALLRKALRWSARASRAAPDQVAIADGRTAIVLNGDGQELWRADPAPSTVTDLWGLRAAATAPSAASPRRPDEPASESVPRLLQTGSITRQPGQRTQRNHERGQRPQPHPIGAEGAHRSRL